MRTLNWELTEERAQRMTTAELQYAIADCLEAGGAAWDMEKNGYSPSKTQGYYHDEASCYRTELNRR